MGRGRVLSETLQPPVFSRLTAHRLRWRLVTELASSDRQVCELTDVLGERQSLVSYHLGQLRRGGLVSARRSSANGRGKYYALELENCRDQIVAAGSALYPGLQLAPWQPATGTTPMDLYPSAPPVRVLLLCTGNSARSQMAQALLEHLSAGAVEAASAGSRPTVLHPLAVAVMGERGIDLSGRRAKHLSEYLDQRFDYVITLCDRVREVCPDFPAEPRTAHWSIPDPSVADDQDVGTFRLVAEELEKRIGFFLRAIVHAPASKEFTHDQ